MTGFVVLLSIVVTVCVAGASCFCGPCISKVFQVVETFLRFCLSAASLPLDPKLLASVDGCVFLVLLLHVFLDQFLPFGPSIS